MDSLSRTAAVRKTIKEDTQGHRAALVEGPGGFARKLSVFLSRHLHMSEQTPGAYPLNIAPSPLRALSHVFVLQTCSTKRIQQAYDRHEATARYMHTTNNLSQLTTRRD